jgi:hypothetical protein
MHLSVNGKSKWWESPVTFVIALVAVVFFGLLIALLLLPGGKKAIEIDKIIPTKSAEEVDAFFKENVGVMQQFTTVVWTMEGSDFNEEDLFFQYGAETKAEKEEIQRELSLTEAVRYTKTCYNMKSAGTEDWSLGYCQKVESPISTEES